MKRQAALFIFLIYFASASVAQGLALKIQYGQFYPVLSKLKGSVPNCNMLYYKNSFPDVSLEYQTNSGLLFSGTVGWQMDQYNFSERIPFLTYGGPVIINKQYKSVPVIFSSGYVYNLGRSPFRLNAQVGIGLGFISSTDFDRDYTFDGIVMLSGPSGIEDDTQHVRIIITDDPVKNIVPQSRASVSLEYHRKHFFVRTAIEIRSWLSSFEKIQYHSENSSTHFRFDQTNDGYYHVRPGYWGIAVGIGWYVNAQNK